MLSDTLNMYPSFKERKNYHDNMCLVGYFITLQLIQLLQHQMLGLFMDAELEKFWSNPSWPTRDTNLRIRL